MGNRLYEEREAIESSLRNHLPLPEMDVWPDDDPDNCIGCGEKFGLTLDSAMRSRFNRNLCVGCSEAQGEMLDDLNDEPL